MILTSEERKKFAAYLRRDAESNRLLAQQFDKLAEGPTGRIINLEHLKKQKLTVAAAEDLVATMLENTHNG